MSAPVNIPTRYALVKRAEKILREIDDFFQDADDFGLTIKEADPKGALIKIRAGIISMLENEGRIKARLVK